MMTPGAVVMLTILFEPFIQHTIAQFRAKTPPLLPPPPL